MNIPVSWVFCLGAGNVTLTAADWRRCVQWRCSNQGRASIRQTLVSFTHTQRDCSHVYPHAWEILYLLWDILFFAVPVTIKAFAANIHIQAVKQTACLVTVRQTDIITIYSIHCTSGSKTSPPAMVPNSMLASEGREMISEPPRKRMLSSLARDFAFCPALCESNLRHFCAADASDIITAVAAAVSLMKSFLQTAE